MEFGRREEGEVGEKKGGTQEGCGVHAARFVAFNQRITCVY